MTLDEIETLRASLQAHAADGNWCEKGALAIAELQRRCRELQEDLKVASSLEHMAYDQRDAAFKAQRKAEAKLAQRSVKQK